MKKREKGKGKDRYRLMRNTTMKKLCINEMSACEGRGEREMQGVFTGRKA